MSSTATFCSGHPNTGMRYLRTTYKCTCMHQSYNCLMTTRYDLGWLIIVGFLYGYKVPPTLIVIASNT